jgi:hypothetical protein
MAPGAGMQGAQYPGSNSKAAANPIAEGMDGIKTLRNMGNCTIPEESQKLNAQLQVLLNMDGDNEVAEAALGKGLFAGLKMNKHCRTHTKTRVAVMFDKDEKLKGITQQLKDAEEKALNLQRQLQEIANNAQELLTERWTYSVKTFGLNPDANFYRIDEDKGIIEQVELECHECTGGQSMIDARLTVEKYVQELQPKEEDDDESRNKQGPGTGGEEAVQK